MRQMLVKELLLRLPILAYQFSSVDHTQQRCFQSQASSDQEPQAITSVGCKKITSRSTRKTVISEQLVLDLSEILNWHVMRILPLA